MNKKGQALVEFLFIIPILAILLLAIFDYARITQTKFELETKLEDVILHEVSLDDDEELKIEKVDDNKKYILKKKITIFSPALSVFMGTKYEISCERVVYE